MAASRSYGGSFLITCIKIEFLYLLYSDRCDDSGAKSVTTFYFNSALSTALEVCSPNN